MDLPAPLAWLVDEASAVSGADRFLARSARCCRRRPAAGRRRADAGAAAPDHRAPHLAVARRDRRGDRGAGLRAGIRRRAEQAKVGRDWLAGLGTEWCRRMRGPARAAGRAAARLGRERPFDPAETGLLRQVARFAAAPLAALAARSALAALLEAYLGRRSAAQVLAGRLRRETGETIRAVLLYADLRGFTELSEAIAAGGGGRRARRLVRPRRRRGSRLRRRSAEIHRRRRAGDLSGRRAAAVDRLRCGACARSTAARAGMAHLDKARQAQGLPPLPFGMALHLGEMLWGNIGTADRLDFTAIGPAVNLVSRLEGLCRPLGRTVLVSGAVAAETTHAAVAARRARAARHRRAMRRVHLGRRLIGRRSNPARLVTHPAWPARTTVRRWVTAR